MGSNRPLSYDEAVVLAATHLSSWENTKRSTVSVDAADYAQLFNFVPVKHTVHDQTQNPIIIVLDKKQAIQLTRNRYGLQKLSNAAHIR